MFAKFILAGCSAFSSAMVYQAYIREDPKALTVFLGSGVFFALLLSILPGESR